MEIKTLKSQLDIVEVAHRLGITVDRTKRAKCPFHDDKTPSLQFSKEKQICTCFSSNCNAGTMDVISLTEKTLKLSTHQAIKWLEKHYGLEEVAAPQAIIKEQPFQLARTAFLTKIFQSFKKGIYNSEQAKGYAESRGLNINELEIGYNSGQFHHRENKHLIESAVKCGLLIPNPSGGHVVTGKGCIVFALKNKQKQISSLYFRDIEESKASKHWYLKDRTGLYPCYPEEKTRSLILTESIIDAATLLQLSEITKDHSVLACYGTNGYKEQYECIQSLSNLEEVIIFFDGDDAGKEGASQRAAELQGLRSDVSISIVETLEKEDINSLSQSHEQTIFTYLLENRKQVSFTAQQSQGLLSEGDLNHLSAKIENGEERSRADSNQLNAQNPYKIIYQTETATYLIKGGIRKELDSMKISLDIATLSNQKFRTKLDLYEDKQVEKTAREAAEKLNLRADLIERDLARLTDELDLYRESQDNKQETKQPMAVPASTKERCIAFLSEPNLLTRINELIGKAGVVGEEKNRLFLFGIATSYKMPDTLHALVQGSSGSGKTHLIIKISEFIPPEDCKCLTRVTESSFYNYGEYELSNKLFCMEDLDGLKEEAFLAFRELQSRGQLTSSTSAKDEGGNIRAMIKTVKGPIASLSATTKGEVYEDNMSRSFLISVDETRVQTHRIIEYQNQRAAGAINKQEEKEAIAFMRNCVRLLQPYEVVNPYANQVKLPEQAHKIRRLNDLYQCYVKQITLLNQYRRQKDKTGRLIADKEDLQLASEIMFDSIILKVDELDGSLRHFYEQLKEYVKGKGADYQSYGFTRKEIRDALRVSKTQQHRFFNDLIELEYIFQQGGMGREGHRYKVLVWDEFSVLKAKIKQYLKGQLDQLNLF